MRVIKESKHVLRSMSDLRGAGNDRPTAHAETLTEGETDCNHERLVQTICDEVWKPIPDDGPDDALEIRKSDFFMFINIM